MAEKVLLSFRYIFFLLPLVTFICAFSPKDWRSQGLSLHKEKATLCIYLHSSSI